VTDTTRMLLPIRWLLPLLLALMTNTAVAVTTSEPLLIMDTAVPVPASTEADAESNSGVAADELPSLSAQPGMVDRSRRWIAGYLDGLSGDLDTFFVDAFFGEDILEDDVGGSRAKLSFYTRRELGDPVDYKFGISVNLELPRISERLNLLLESDDEEAREADPFESVENNNYSAALRFIFRETDQWKTTLDSGIRWGIPPDPFSRLRARRYAWFSEWEMKVTQTLYWFSSKGWGEDTTIQMNYPLNVEKLLRLNAKADYLLDDDYFKLSYSAGLYHELSRRAALAYVAGASGSTRSATATFNSYSASVRYRRLIYQDWVFAEVQPELVWESEKEYETTPVIMFRIESLISD